jgi:hypothetical protein
MSHAPCAHKGQWDNFCSNCGTQLKKPCSECNCMEPIGRAHCAEKVKHVQKEILQYQNDNINMTWKRFLDPELHPGILLLLTLSLLIFGMALIMYLLSIALSTFSFSVGGLVIILAIGICLLIFAVMVVLIKCISMNKSRREQLTQQFLIQHPHYNGMV